MAPDSKEERYFYFNTLAILLKAVQNERTTIDLRNEASVYGIVEHTDAWVIFRYMLSLLT